MKIFFFVGSVLCLAIPSVPLRAQESPAPDSYQRCFKDIKQAPQDAYAPCQQYLEESPSDDQKRIEHVKQWIAKYEKVRPYVQFLQGLAADQKAPWFVYEPDLSIKLPQTSQKEGPYKIEISRWFSDSREEELLTKAEAVYSSPGEMVEDVFEFLDYWANEPPQEMAPIWGMRGNDEIQSTHTVTARAVRYYYDLTQTMRRNPHLPSGFDAANTNLKYTAEIKHFDHYSHKKDTFENVYVADLTLEWGFVCGGLCGMGFTRNKLVVLDSNGEVIALYLDAPVNSESWVS